MLSIIKLRLMKLKREYFVFLIMTAMAIAFTYVTGVAGNSDYTPKILIVDQDNSIASEMIVKELQSEATFKYEEVPYTEAVEEVDKGKVVAAILIKKGFNNSIDAGEIPTLGLVKIKDDRDIFTLESILRGITSKMIGNMKSAEITANFIGEYKEIDHTALVNKAYAKAQEAWLYRKPIEVTKETIESNTNGYDNTKHGIIGFSLFFSMYTIVFAIGEILNERKNNTWQRQIISPLTKTSILGGNFVISYLVGLFQIGILILAGRYLFGVDYGPSMIGILTIVVAFVFAVTSLGLFLSGLVKTHAQLSALTPVILTSMGMLGGTMWPLEIVNSKFILLLANLTPTKWAVMGMEKIAMYGAGFDAAVIPTLILLTMGLIFFGFGVKLVKYE